jgi:hypothetical protein
MDNGLNHGRGGMRGGAPIVAGGLLSRSGKVDAQCFPVAERTCSVLFFLVAIRLSGMYAARDTQMFSLPLNQSQNAI